MPHDHSVSKLCLKCARARLAGKKTKPCGSCILLNIDPLAQTRANAARPNKLARFSFSPEARAAWARQVTAQKPARSSYGGGVD